MNKSTGKGILFVLSAPSGAGKTTLAHHVIANVPDIVQSVSYTTREKREDEIDGVHYHFVDTVEFEKMIENHEFAEHARVHGRHYGTAYRTIQDAKEKKQDILLVIDVQGAAQLRRSGIDMVSIFLLAPSMGELKERLSKRGTEDPAVVEARLQEAEREIAQCGRYDYLIVNDNLETSKKDIEGIIRAERLRLERKDNDMVDYEIPDLFLEEE